MIDNKKGMSIGYTFVYGLVVLFGIGVLYIVFSQVFNAYLVPTIQNQVTSPSANIANETQTVILESISKYMHFFNILPFILFFLVVIYLFIAALRKEGEAY